MGLQVSASTAIGATAKAVHIKNSDFFIFNSLYFVLKQNAAMELAAGDLKNHKLKMTPRFLERIPVV